jgi:toxin-antitoxin system PIN domain toxin
MLVVDTNILVYAIREETQYHLKAKKKLFKLANGDEPWGIPIFCLGEYLRLLTHPKVFTPPTPIKLALDNLQSLLETPSCSLLLANSNFGSFFVDECLSIEAMGNQVFDVQIVALMRSLGCKRILTLDSDFRKYEKITVEGI